MENDRGIIVYCSGVVFHFFVGDDDGYSGYLSILLYATRSVV